METMLRILLSLSAGGTLLAALLMLLQRVLKKRMPAAFAYYAWLLVLLRFVLPLPGLLPAAERAPAQPAALPVVEAAPAAQSGAPSAPRSRSTESGQTNAVTAAAPLPDAGSETREEKSAFDFAALWSAAKKLLGDWRFWGAVYLAGAGISLLRYGVGFLRFRRALGKTFRRAQESDRLVLESLNPTPWPALCRSRAVRTPMLLGLLRPVIVLPDRDYDDEMLRGILRHELTHYRRGDLAYKWFAVLVSSLHWFNPFFSLFRREIDRACELSCDERLLRRMGREEKQHYGELLLALAADRPLPRSVVAMSFATEKRNLKERLLQIMKYKNKGRAGLALALIVILLLSGCGMALGPRSGAVLTANAAAEPTPSVIVTAFPVPNPDLDAEAASDVPPTPMPDDGGDVTEVFGENIPKEKIVVHDVDELLAAIGSDRVIQLTDGEYNLTKAAGYGSEYRTEHLSWLNCGDGYELHISDVHNLYIVGHDKQSSVVTEPRYANVMAFDWCSNVNVVSLTAGHTTAPGYCAGGVLYFLNCEDMYVSGCDLYGCGTLGISAVNCSGVTATSTVIRECTNGAMDAYGSYDVRFLGGKVLDCGLKGDSGAYNLFNVQTSTGFVIFNTEISGNRAQVLLHSSSSLGVQMRGCYVHDNTISEKSYPITRADGSKFIHATGGVFQITGKSPVIDACSFENNELLGMGMYFNYNGESAGTVVDGEGRELALEDLEAMERADYLDVYSGPQQPEAVPPEGEVNDFGETAYHVDNVDDFLAAIGSNTTIYVDAELIDFSTASNYGGYGGTSYYWRDDYDGPGLVISGVQNLHIIGQGKDKTTLRAVPRYADVLYFEDCSNISVEDLTAGHLKEAPGSCAGDVLEFYRCGEILVRGCGLFGCGVNAVYATSCQGLTVEDTEMYEYSGEGAIIWDCSGVSFDNCSIHDCPSNSVNVYNSLNVTWNGQTLREGLNVF
jgi:beta-lactamase regulating signal transducer with metallopeptidase domain